MIRVIRVMQLPSADVLGNYSVVLTKLKTQPPAAAVLLWAKAALCISEDDLIPSTL